MDMNEAEKFDALEKAVHAYQTAKSSNTTDELERLEAAFMELVDARMVEFLLDKIEDLRWVICEEMELRYE
jgi:hypothetical protein